MLQRHMQDTSSHVCVCVCQRFSAVSVAAPSDGKILFAELVFCFSRKRHTDEACLASFCVLTATPYGRTFFASLSVSSRSPLHQHAAVPYAGSVFACFVECCSTVISTNSVCRVRLMFFRKRHMDEACSDSLSVLTATPYGRTFFASLSVYSRSPLH